MPDPGLIGPEDGREAQTAATSVDAKGTVGSPSSTRLAGTMTYNMAALETNISKLQLEIKPDFCYGCRLQAKMQPSQGQPQAARSSQDDRE